MEYEITIGLGVGCVRAIVECDACGVESGGWIGQA